jgi:hypothetical protein
MAYEDFTTYTEVDAGSDITVDSAVKVSWSDLYTRQDTGYLYKDKGVNHFDGDFTHKFECICSSKIGDALLAFWMLSNTVGDVKDAEDANDDFLVFTQSGHTITLYLRIYENGSVVDSDSWACSLATLYYVEIVRDDDGGVNNTGRVTAYIRTGSHSGSLQATLTADCSAGEQNDYRNVYAVATYDYDVGLSVAAGYTQNLDLGEAPAGWTGKICGVTNPAKICGVAVADIASVMGN